MGRRRMLAELGAGPSARWWKRWWAERSVFYQVNSIVKSLTVLHRQSWCLCSIRLSALLPIVRQSILKPKFTIDLPPPPPHGLKTVGQLCIRNAISDWFDSFFDDGNPLFFVTVSLIVTDGLAVCVCVCEKSKWCSCEHVLYVDWLSLRLSQRMVEVWLCVLPTEEKISFCRSTVSVTSAKSADCVC